MRIKQFAAMVLATYAVSVFASSGLAVVKNDIHITESDLGVLCVQAAFPAATRGVARNSEKTDESLNNEEIVSDNTTGEAAIIDTQNPESPTPATANAQKGKPLVLIYHTHATEAYKAHAEWNYRTTEEEGSVRDVGNVLTEELEKMGIEVIHDKTLHDAESYNQSYSKSLATVNKLLSENPSVVFVIDLHRDAAAYLGGGKTTTVNGETVATYSLVVGQGNENANSLNMFADAINRKAEEMYPGFGGRIIGKQYKYNQYVSDYHILLEVGNNENTIKECRKTAKYFAQVYKAVIDDVT